MSDSVELVERIRLVVRRCYTCGRYYGGEPGFDFGCGKCTNDYWRNAQKAVAARDKTIASLRGALTKAKKRGER